MPNMRLNFTRQDKKTLEIFFINRTENNPGHLKLADIWKSTMEVSKELNESWKRTLLRLKKLSGFGFLYSFSINYHRRVDRYWAINREAVYYIMSTLDSNELIIFLRLNSDKLREFSDIEELALKKEIQVRYLTSQIQNIVKKYQYFLLENFIEKWHQDNLSPENWSTKFGQPDMKKILKKNYGKDKEMMKILSHRYGRIE